VVFITAKNISNVFGWGFNNNLLWDQGSIIWYGKRTV
jgi:hypothetical protein